jgi:SAM-dependent methyltransferase
MVPQGRLTDGKYWDRLWISTAEQRRSGLKRLLLDDGATRQLFHSLLPRFLPRERLRMIELGSAPGRLMLRWREAFPYDVYGVDFSPEGAKAQRDLLARHGVAEDHTYCADVLDPMFQQSHEESYDVVYSAGLIEHFTDPREMVGAHLRLLKAGGHLVISIPNFRGIYGKLISREVLDTHNLEIMRAAAFQRVFDGFPLEMLFCGYFGRLNLGLGFGGPTLLHRILPKAQIVANVMILAHVPIPETRWTSPYLYYIGRKLA